MSRTLLGRALLHAGALALLAGATARGDGRGAPAGTYRLEGTARVQARPVVDRAEDIHATAAVASGGKGGATKVRLTSQGYRCDLEARAGGAGELAFDPGQRCTIALAEKEARGRVEATLASGHGRITDGRLQLELSWNVSGAVSLFVGGERYEVMGREVEVPGGWAPEVPLRGTATTRAAGPRDDGGAARR